MSTDKTCLHFISTLHLLFYERWHFLSATTVQSILNYSLRWPTAYRLAERFVKVMVVLYWQTLAGSIALVHSIALVVLLQLANSENSFRKTQTQTTMTRAQTAKRAKREEGIVQTATAKERGEWLRKVLTRKRSISYPVSFHLILIG